jgi:hypothetical protein
MTDKYNDGLRWVRPCAWGASAMLILLPLFAMKIADPMAWNLADLPFAFVMIAAVGLAFEFALRVPAIWAYVAGSALAVGAAALLILGNLAVGFAGSEDNAINIIFFVIPALALIGSVVVSFRPYGVSIALACAAAAQITAGLIAYYHGHFTAPLTVTFSALWLASSLLFLRSSRVPLTVRDSA